VVERGRKPGFVPGFVASPGWSSFICAALPGTGRAAPARTSEEIRAVPTRPCSRRGLPCDPCHQRPGALLPHLFTLTCANAGGCISVALSFESPRLAYASTLPCGARTFLDPITVTGVGPRSPYPPRPLHLPAGGVTQPPPRAQGPQRAPAMGPALARVCRVESQPIDGSVSATVLLSFRIGLRLS